MFTFGQEKMDLEGEVAKRRSLDGALARLSGAPEALAELSADGLAALEEELEASLRLVRAAKERRQRWRPVPWKAARAS